VAHVLFFLALYLIIQLLLVGVGAAVGLLLHWVAPAVDLGSAVLIGVVSTGFSVHFFGKLISALDVDVPGEEGDDEERVVRLYPVKPPRPRRRKR
jgi:hypothetical protein